jgi:hypothetical protein
MARTHPRQNDSLPEAEEPTLGASGRQTVQRPVWEVIAEIGAQIPDELWAMVPDDGSINYKHYLYGVPQKEA